MEIVIDGKIVSIRHYLNKTLSPVIENDVTKYPLYTQVNFDKNNTRFKSIRDHLFFTKEDIYIDETKGDSLTRIIAQNTDPLIKGVLDTEQRMLKIIEKEYSINSSLLKGLAKKFLKYGKLLSDIIRVEAEARLLEICRGLLIYNDYIKVEQARSMMGKYNVLKQFGKYDDFVSQLETEARSDLGIIRASISLDEFEKENGKANSTLYSWLFENGEKRYKEMMKKSSLSKWSRYENDFEYKLNSDAEYITSYIVMNVF